MLSFLIPEGPLDRVKCMKMALVHDLAEAIVGDNKHIKRVSTFNSCFRLQVGDITPYCGIDRDEKKKREEKAIEEISSLVPKTSGDEILQLFHEYENQETPEALWVKDCDRYDMVQQAFEYEKRDEVPMKHQEFFESTKGKFKHQFFVNLVDELNKQREEYHENFASNLGKKNISAS